MKFERLAGRREEAALVKSERLLRLGPKDRAEDVFKATGGWMQHSDGEGSWMWTGSMVKIDVTEGDVTYTKTYPLEDWIVRARDAQQGHQIDMFELLEGEA